MAETIAGTNAEDDAVRDSTGRSWPEWFAWLEDHHAESLDHRAIIDLLDSEAELPTNWWRQQVTSTFERHLGRQVAAVAEANLLQVGVQRTYRSSPTRAWGLIASPAGARAWLGDEPTAWWHGHHGGPERGDIIQTPGGERYEVKSGASDTRIQLRTLGPGLFESTIQLTISAERGRTVIVLHQEGVPEAAMIDQMREHWTRALDRLSELLDEA